MLVGIVGKPNVGKSTFFKAATLADVLIANYPFATIKPNHAMAYVKIKDLAAEFNKVSNPREGYVKSGWRFVPFELVDVAGLVEGAAEGKGLGIEFLNDLTTADAMIMVVDVSGETDSEGKPTENYDPSHDIQFVERELDKWYLSIFKKVWSSLIRNIEIEKKQFSQGVAKQFSGLKVTEEDVQDVVVRGKFEISQPSQWTEVELLRFAQTLRRFTKPIVIAANKIDRPKGRENFEKIKKAFDYLIVPCFSDGELALREAARAGLIEYVPGDKRFEVRKDLNDKQKSALQSIQHILDHFGSTGVQEVLNKTVFDILQYVAVYPAGSKLVDSKGNVLPDCYLMPPGSTALDFAFKIHQDIGKHFVKAVDIKTKLGVGKDYKLKMGDGLEIMTR